MYTQKKVVIIPIANNGPRDPTNPKSVIDAPFTQRNVPVNKNF